MLQLLKSHFFYKIHYNTKAEVAAYIYRKLYLRLRAIH